MERITLYLRKEQTTDPIQHNAYFQWAKNELKNLLNKNDIVAYGDESCQNVLARWMWFNESKPTRRNKFLTIAGYKYSIVWVN